MTRHDGWTPQVQEQVQPGDPLLDPHDDWAEWSPPTVPDGYSLVPTAELDRLHPDDGHEHRYTCIRCGVDSPDLDRLRAARVEAERALNRLVPLLPSTARVHEDYRIIRAALGDRAAERGRLRAAAEQAFHWFVMSAGEYHAHYGSNDEPIEALRAALGDRAAERGLPKMADLGTAEIDRHTGRPLPLDVWDDPSEPALGDRAAEEGR